MSTERAAGPLLDAGLLQASGAMLAAQIALGAAIERAAVAGTGHDPTTLDLLVRLDLAPDNRLRAVELCRQLQKSPSHVSRILDRTEAAGLTRRAPDPDDRRAKTVVLTDPGRSVVTDFAPRLHAVLDQTIHQVLEPDETRELIDYLNRIESAARQCSAPPS